MSWPALEKVYDQTRSAFEEIAFAPEDELAWWRIKVIGVLFLLESIISSMNRMGGDGESSFSHLPVGAIQEHCSLLVEALGKGDFAAVEQLAEETCTLLVI